MAELTKMAKKKKQPKNEKLIDKTVILYVL